MLQAPALGQRAKLELARGAVEVLQSLTVQLGLRQVRLQDGNLRRLQRLLPQHVRSLALQGGQALELGLNGGQFGGGDGVLPQQLHATDAEHAREPGGLREVRAV